MNRLEVTSLDATRMVVFSCFACNPVPSKRLNWSSKSPSQPLPISIVIANYGREETLRFHCSPSITAQRVCSVACQLFGLDEFYYHLIAADSCTIIDESATLESLGMLEPEIRLRLNSTVIVGASDADGKPVHV